MSAGPEPGGAPGPVSLISAVPPLAAPLRVVHLHGRAEAAVVGRWATHQSDGGWTVATRRIGPGPRLSVLRRYLAEQSPDVVVLHGTRAGVYGRLALRGRRPTVFVPGRWSFSAGFPLLRPPAVVWERVAARWTNAVVVADASAARLGVRRRVWAPPFVVQDPDRVAAVLARAHAYGSPEPTDP